MSKFYFFFLKKNLLTILKGTLFFIVLSSSNALKKKHLTINIIPLQCYIILDRSILYKMLKRKSFK